MLTEMVKAFSRRFASRELTAEDLAQDAAVAIIRAGGAALTDAQRSVIGINAIRDSMRNLRYRRQVRPMPEQYDAEQPSRWRPDEEATYSDLVAQLTGRISPRAKVVLTRLLEGKSRVEIARELSLAPCSISRSVTEISERARELGVH
jgi:DNA-directed RNA polymerase specialized sigma24 family protein